MSRCRWVLPTLLCLGSSFAAEPAHLTEVPFTKVKIADPFFAPRREINRTISLPHSLDMLEKAGNMENLELAAKGAHTGYHGPVFMDSDLYKSVEAISYSLATDPDPVLDARLDRVIAKIAAAQMKDGYIDTWYQVNAPDKRFTNLRDHHELYCAGHLFEAAVAHHQATKKTTLLDVATKYADLLCATFGSGPGKRPGYCGHPEIELALVKLSNETGKQEYFDLAKHFIDARGSKFFAVEHGEPLDRYDGGYFQDNVPLRDLKGVVGHAVRFGYLMSGATDVVAKTGDEALSKMLRRVWRNVAEKNTFLTGGIGPSGSNEGFTEDYDLPTQSAYQETCATVALAMWNHRMNLLFGDAKYADCVETALYNGVPSGGSQDGKRYFYVNPLESLGGHHRTEWFSCACCPPNEARTLSALGNYVYATGADGFYVNLYVAGRVDTKVGDALYSMDVATEYPWSGKVRFTMREPMHAPLHLRVPSWCDRAVVEVNEKSFKARNDRGYLVIDPDFKAGDVVTLDLSMPVRRVQAHPAAKELRGLTAFVRGPVVYCFESCDQVDSNAQPVPLDRVFVPEGASFEPKARHDLLGGVHVLEGEGRIGPDPNWSSSNGGLYRAVLPSAPIRLVAIPYADWDNRAQGAMKVWFPSTPAPPVAGSLEKSAKVSVSFKNWNSEPEAIHDGADPVSSDHQPATLCHFWDHHGGTEWVTYSWEKPVAVSGVKVYWFDDTGRGACRLPKAWRLLAKDGDAWKPVGKAADFTIAKDKWCEFSFETITTKELKLEVDMQDAWAAGIHEWQVVAAETDDG